MHSYVLMFLFICCISGPLLCLPLDVFPVQTFPMENEMITFARNLGVEADIMAICMEWFLLFFFFLVCSVPCQFTLKPAYMTQVHLLQKAAISRV